jgi:hypothetical protein
VLGSVKNSFNLLAAAVGAGVIQAILLAETLRVDVLLIDEQIGRTIALSRNLPLSVTLGVLERAEEMGFVSDFLQFLQDVNRLSPSR